MKTWLIETTSGSLHKIEATQTPKRDDYVKVLKIPANLEAEEAGSLKISSVLIDPDFPEMGNQDIVELDSIGQTAVIAQQAQNARDIKLEKIREVRKPLLSEVDLMINELTLGDRVDTAAVKTYRDELKALTDPYKDVNGDAVALIDSLNDDVSDLVLPTKP